MKMLRNTFFFLLASYFEHFEIWGCLLRIGAKLCCIQTSNIHVSSMAESIFTIYVSFDSTIRRESVLLIKVHLKSQIGR